MRRYGTATVSILILPVLYFSKQRCLLFFLRSLFFSNMHFQLLTCDGLSAYELISSILSSPSLCLASCRIMYSMCGVSLFQDVCLFISFYFMSALFLPLSNSREQKIKKKTYFNQSTLFHAPFPIGYNITDQQGE